MTWEMTAFLTESIGELKRTTTTLPKKQRNNKCEITNDSNV